MKKLLLLTTLPLLAFLYSFANTGQGYHAGNTPATDSSIAGAKGGFKDLFEGTHADGSLFNVKLNPKAVSFVQDYVESHSGMLQRMKSWGKPYFDLIDDVLEKRNLPTELKYLAVIESQLKTSAVSWAGAVGPWQLMPQTARELGLRVTRKVDERRDYKKSTHAAARYLNELYGIFNDWLLVIAAYNGGPGNVNQAIRKSGSRNFWELQYYLPAESRNHVKKFIATHYIMEGDGGITTMTRTEHAEHNQFASATEKALPDGMESQTISGKFNAGIMAQTLQMDMSAFNRLNPSFDKLLSQNGTYELRLSAEKMALFEERRNLILEQSVRAALTLANR